MKFLFFHLMPWDSYPKEGPEWPVSNRDFDPVKGTEVYQTYIDTMAYAEDCGFDAVGCNEHHFSPFGLMSNPNLIGSALIQRTKKIKLAMVGSLVPLLNPIRVAEEYAMLDVMSGGRLMAGILRGIPHEYVAYNVPPDESRDRLEEAAELIVKAWTSREPFGWNGHYYNFPAVSIWPRPRQLPHPPIIMSASNDDSARTAARHRAIMGLALVPDLKVAKHLIDTYMEAAHEAGWQPAPDHVLVGLNTCIAETSQAAQDELAKGSAYFGKVLLGGPRTAQKLVLQKSRYFSDDDVRKEFVGRIQNAKERSLQESIDAGVTLCGTPDEVVTQIARVREELGCGWINMNMKVGNVPNDGVRRSMELFRDHVRPVFPVPEAAAVAAE